MRTLADSEIFFDENGERENGFIPVETSITELALAHAALCCGELDNDPFTYIAMKFTGRVYGWFHPTDVMMIGMIQIECADEYRAKMMSELAEMGHGVLRPDGPSMKDGFWEFENE